MPELPEVETMRRGIAAIAGSTDCRARCAGAASGGRLRSSRGKSLARRLAGQRIEEVGRLGKRVVLRLDSGDRLIFEPRMTGLVLVADPPTQEHLRFRLDLDGGPIPHVWYWDRRGLGSRAAAHRAAVRRAARQRHSWVPTHWPLRPTSCASRLATSRRAIKVALLDQRAVAGIGNLYASEFCTWPAFIRPSAAIC